MLAWWAEEGVSTEHLEPLFDSLDGSGMVPGAMRERLSQAVLRALLSEDYWAESQRYLVFGRLRAKGRISRQEAETRAMKDKFVSSLDAMMDLSDFTESDAALESIDEVERAARALEVDLESVWDVEQTREEARGIGASEDDYVDDDEPRGSSGDPSDIGDAEIDEMFSGLNDVSG